jgi:hypothetical protein
MYDPTDSEFHVGFYECGVCSTAVRFTTTDFESHAGSRSQLLAGDLDKEFTAARPLQQDEWVLDFCCPGCRRPVRVIFSWGNSIAMGCWGFEALYVLECAVEAEHPVAE